MKPPTDSRWARAAQVGGTILFLAVLTGFVVLIVQHRYDAAVALSVGGIYAEMWNARVSRPRN